MFADVYVEVSSDSNLSRKFLNERETFEKRNQSQIEEESQVNSDLEDLFSPQKLAEVFEAAKDSTPGDDKITVPVIRHLSKAAK
jgi:hypothetical protein